MFGRIIHPNAKDMKHATARSLDMMFSMLVGWKPGTTYTIGWLQNAVASMNASTSAPSPPATKVFRAGWCSYMCPIIRVIMFFSMFLRAARPMNIKRAEPPQAPAMWFNNIAFTSRRRSYTGAALSLTNPRNASGSADAGRCTGNTSK